MNPSKFFKIVIQVSVLILFSLLGNSLVQWFRLPISGSIIGLLLIFILLKLQIFHLEWIESGANWLLTELLLFFIPSAVGIIQYKSLIITQGSQFLLVILISTIAVMTSTGLIAELILKFQKE